MDSKFQNLKKCSSKILCYVLRTINAKKWRSMKQLKLFQLPREVIFGGSTLEGKRKSKRPLSTKNAIHSVLRGDVRQCGSFRSYPRRITKMINRFAKRFDVQIYEFSINSNHIHLLFKLSLRENFGRFMRALAGALSLEFGVKWYHRPYSRIVDWGKAFLRAKNYVIKNQMESNGEITYVRKTKAQRKREHLKTWKSDFSPIGQKLVNKRNCMIASNFARARLTEPKFICG